MGLSDDNTPCNDVNDDCDNLRPNPWEEPCGFVVHLFALLAAILYSFYIVHLYGSFALIDSSCKYGDDVPIPAWTWMLPLSLVILFFAVPMGYGLLNATVVVAPHTGSLAILQDSYTNVPPFPSPLQRILSGAKQADLSDPSVRKNIEMYYRRPMEWNEDDRGNAAWADDSIRCIIPAICDIDVADMNDWVAWKTTVAVSRTS